MNISTIVIDVFSAFRVWALGFRVEIVCAVDVVFFLVMAATVAVHANFRTY